MGTSWVIRILLFLLLPLFSVQLYSQDLELYSMIGKNINTVINTYGKPVHQDRTNPQMECVFYKTKTTQKTFVANTEGVFQAEGSFCYSDLSTARNTLDKIISLSIAKDFRVDTLNTDNFALYGNDTKIDLSIFDNSLSKRYEIKIKAQKSLGVK